MFEVKAREQLPNPAAWLPVLPNRSTFSDHGQFWREYRELADNYPGDTVEDEYQKLAENLTHGWFFDRIEAPSKHTDRYRYRSYLIFYLAIVLDDSARDSEQRF